MKKKIISILLVVCLLASLTTVFAADAETQQKADALNLLGLFQGTNNGYELDKTLTREQGIVMLLRALGLEPEAQGTTASIPFTDVYDWAKPYVSYAFREKITQGISATQFGYGKPLSDNMFLTLILRALGYQDGEGKDFTWDKPYELAKKIGLISDAAADTSFTRGDMVTIIWAMLDAKFADSDFTVLDNLAENEIISKEFAEQAKLVASGKTTLADAKRALGISDTGDLDDMVIGGGDVTPAPGGGDSGYTPPSPTIGGDTEDEEKYIPLYEAKHETPDMNP